MPYHLTHLLLFDAADRKIGLEPGFYVKPVKSYKEERSEPSLKNLRLSI